ncbi:hypothetical protein EVAR_10638_1 [Eumeta japonica]|uniref:Uncharacterized protein n=1 Tax=Eumeta variegata TaxID=151549 RepID=A0A4C1U732_EUMVA|nr:hypothetical protein EVAR_10638_1 [Eumeta japonica]
MITAPVDSRNVRGVISSLLASQKEVRSYFEVPFLLYSTVITAVGKSFQSFTVRGRKQRIKHMVVKRERDGADGVSGDRNNDGNLKSLPKAKHIKTDSCSSQAHVAYTDLETTERVVSPAGHRLLQDSEDRTSHPHGYEVIGPDSPSRVPIDPRFGADVLDIVL